MVALPDLRHRARRFSITVVGMALIFAVTILLSGFSEGFEVEARRLVKGIGVDAFVVTEDSSGPFTAFAVFDESSVDPLSAQPGVEGAEPLIVLFSAVRHGSQSESLDVVVIGRRIPVQNTPSVIKGRFIEGPGEATLDEASGLSVGDTVAFGEIQLDVVGITERTTIANERPAMFVDLGDAQTVTTRGAPLISAVGVNGSVDPPAGLKVLDEDDTVDDMLRPLAGAKNSIDSFKFTLWVLATIITGAVLYLAALERTRDFAVLKATGAPSRSLIMGLVLQAVLLAVLASFLAMVLAKILSPIYPGTISMPVRILWPVPIVAVVIGLVACVFAVRRAVTVDPARAFGGM